MFTYCCRSLLMRRECLVYATYSCMVSTSPPILLVLIGIVDFHLCARAPISL